MTIKHMKNKEIYPQNNNCCFDFLIPLDNQPERKKMMPNYY